MPKLSFLRPFVTSLAFLSSFLLLSPVAFGQGPGQGQNLPALSAVNLGGGQHIRCSSNQGVLLDDVEWKTVPPSSHAIQPSAAVKGSSITADLTFSLTPQAQAFDGKVTINLVRLGTLGLQFPVEAKELEVAPGSSTTITININGLPSVVQTSRTLLITYTVKSDTNPNLMGSGGATMPLYIVQGQSLTPQVNPWIGVLNDACTWAEGQSTTDGIAEKLTLGIYNSGKFVYPDDGKTQWITLDANGEPTWSFKLKSFLAAPNPRQTNCVDISDYLAICANALGVSFQVCYYRDSGAYFQTNVMKLIGKGAYGSIQFQLHQVAHPSGTTTVYDTCLALLRDYNNMAWGKPQYNWPLDKYWQNPVLIQGFTVYYGLVQFPGPSTRLVFKPAYTPPVIAE